MQSQQRISQICQGYEDSALNNYLADIDKADALEREVKRIATDLYGDMKDENFLNAIIYANQEESNAILIWKMGRGDKEAAGLYTDAVMTELTGIIAPKVKDGTWYEEAA